MARCCAEMGQRKFVKRPIMLESLKGKVVAWEGLLVAQNSKYCWCILVYIGVFQEELGVLPG